MHVVLSYTKQNLVLHLISRVMSFIPTYHRDRYLHLVEEALIRESPLLVQSRH
jgi:hypothetical protein